MRPARLRSSARDRTDQLGLERERLRLERRLKLLLRPYGDATTVELAQLTGQLHDTERELADVRALLAELREQTLS